MNKRGMCLCPWVYVHMCAWVCECRYVFWVLSKVVLLNMLHVHRVYMKCTRRNRRQVFFIYIYIYILLYRYYYVYRLCHATFTKHIIEVIARRQPAYNTAAPCCTTVYSNDITLYNIYLISAILRNVLLLLLVGIMWINYSNFTCEACY